MVTKKDLIVAVLCTFCLTSTLFMMTRTRSSPDIGEYDPWLDSNDDGTINILECITLAGAFGTTGTPINKTALLLELQARIDSLNATIVEQQNIINNLNNAVIYLNETLTYINGSALRFLYSDGNPVDLGIVGAPSPRTTGWVTIKSVTLPAKTLLNGTVLVLLRYMGFRYLQTGFSGYARFTVNGEEKVSWVVGLTDNNPPAAIEALDTVYDVRKLVDIDNSVEVTINLQCKIDSTADNPQAYGRIITNEFRVFG
jgi:hypothetical protein